MLSTTKYYNFEELAAHKVLVSACRCVLDYANVNVFSSTRLQG